MSQTRKERIEKEKTTNKQQTKKDSREPKKQEEQVVETMITNTKSTQNKKEIDWKKVIKKTKENITKITQKAIVEIKKGAKKTKEKTAEWNKNRLEEKQKRMEEQEESRKQMLDASKNLHCLVGYTLHKQKLQYGKEWIEFSFGGYINEHTITIVVESTLGIRSHSSTYSFQVEKGTEIHLPGLYNDGTTEFRKITLKVMDMDPKNNTIHLEKNEK